MVILDRKRITRNSRDLRFPRFTAWSRESSSFGADCTKSASLADVVGEWHETRMIRGILGSLPGPEKVPLLVRIAQNLRHLPMLSANGAKFAQFASNSLYLSTKD